MDYVLGISPALIPPTFTTPTLEYSSHRDAERRTTQAAWTPETESIRRLFGRHRDPNAPGTRPSPSPDAFRRHPDICRHGRSRTSTRSLSHRPRLGKKRSSPPYNLPRCSNNAHRQTLTP